MSVKILLLKNGRAAPVITCDYCGQRITDALEGNYEWSGELDGSNQLVDVYFVHKKCSRANEAKVRMPLDSEEMLLLMPYPVHNLKVDWKRATDHLALIEELE